MGKTWTWSYDDAGNILTRTEYNYTTGELGTAIDVVSYAYTDSVWSDLLTAYDGSAITYDAIGNPLTDGRWTYTWEHGRELASMAENTTVVITTQPEDCFCAVGQSCSFTVAAQGERLTYRWQYSANGGTTWIDSVDATAVTSTMTIDVAEASQIGLLWRCIVTDKDGRTAISQSGTVVDSTATRSITITNQPDDFYCATGDTTAFAVEAAGEGLTYHWQYSSDGSEWSNIYSETAFTPTCSWNGVHPSQFGTYYRCQITDADGNVTYSRGARLKRDTTLWEFTYNADGLRTGRTNGDRTYEYTYLGSQLTRMTVDGHTLYFTYDAAGTPLTVSCDGTLYYYITNIQGDVIAIIDTAGTQVTSYIYDAWGNIISHTGSTSTIGRYNPLTYRGYVYDTETRLYYLQSRYYNPKVGRFINADGLLNQQDLLGANLYSYCLNNPVSMADDTGDIPFFLVTAAIGAVAGAIIGGVTAAKNGGNVWAGIGIGAAVGGLAGAGLGAASAVVFAGSATASTSSVIVGAMALGMTTATGGLGAGLTYISNNVNNVATYTNPVLYSGGDTAAKAAESYASASGGTVIQETVIGKAANTLSSAIPSIENTIWTGASELFCRQSSGSAYAMVCNASYDPKICIFWNTEVPTLLRNNKIAEIIIEIF